MTARIIDVAMGLLLLVFGALVAWNGYVGMGLLSFFGVSRWTASPIVALGCLTAASAIGVCFRRKAAGIIGAISLLILAVLFFPASLDESLIVAVWDDKSIQVVGYVAPAALLLAAILVSWRFVFTRRAAPRTI